MSVRVHGFHMFLTHFHFLFIYLGDDVVFLDPHVTQNAVDFDDEQFDDSTYHPETCARITFQSMDPSLAMVRY